MGSIYFTSYYESQNTFIYQPTLGEHFDSNTLESKKGKGTDYVLGLKLKGLYTSKFTPYILLYYIV